MISDPKAPLEGQGLSIRTWTSCYNDDTWRIDRCFADEVCDVLATAVEEILHGNQYRSILSSACCPMCFLVKRLVCRYLFH